MDQQLECAGATCPIILDGSGSTDPDSMTGTNDDIVLFEWFEDFGTPSQQLLASGKVVTVNLPLGTHAVTLKVTDQGGLTDTDPIQIIINPAKLSLVKIESVEIDWPEADILAEIKLHGMLSPPVGVLPAELAPIGEFGLDLVVLDGIDLFSQTVTFVAMGMPVEKWEFSANPMGQGIKSFKINWAGAVFKHQDLIELKTNFIGVTETTFSVDRRGMTTPVSLSVNGIDVVIDSLGNVVTTVPFEIDADGEVTFTLPFELTPDMVITLTMGTDPMQTLLVSDFYTAGKGKYEVIARVDPGALTGASRPADLRVYFTLGAEGFSGSLDVTEPQWKDLSPLEWKAKLTN